MASKGKFVLINPLTRATIKEHPFLYNPTEIKANFKPNYTFKSAALSYPAFAQYNNSEPLEISFSLFLRKEDRSSVQNELLALRELCDVNRSNESFNGMDTPPVTRLIYGDVFSWLERKPLYGVVTELSVTAQYFSPQGYIYHATADIVFKEAYFGSLNAPSR